MKLPPLLRLCLPDRQINPAEPSDSFPRDPSTFSYSYTNLDKDPETRDIFEAYVPKDAVKQWLEKITREVMTRLGYLDGRKGVHVPPRRKIHLIIVNEPGVAWTDHSPSGHSVTTHISSLYLRDVLKSPSGPDILKREIPGVMTHELTHAFQWDGKGTTPGCLIEGTADWVRVKNGVAPIGWRVPEPSPGSKWTDGSATWFLVYLDERFPEFVERLNQIMAGRRFEEDFFYFLTGTNVEVLYQQYQQWLKERKPGYVAAM